MPKGPKARPRPTKKGPKRRPIKPGGKPPFVPTAQMRDVVSMCRVFGATIEETARQVDYEKGGISVDTLYKYFQPELDDNGRRLHLRIANNLASIAANPINKSSVVAAIFWLRSHLGWQQNTTEYEFDFSGRKRIKGVEPPPVVFTLKIGNRLINGSDETIDGVAHEDGDAGE